MFTFSVIIPVKPGSVSTAAEFLLENLSDNPDYEILLAEGCAPSRQRNLAALEASGDLLYFLDDDSLLGLDNFQLCAVCMSDLGIAVVGGPSITPDSDTPLQRLLGYALASVFGSGAVRNRYRVHGKARATSDKELILCNLVVRKQLFNDLGGFNESLYPNEENEFIERVTASGYGLLHIPQMLVFRSQRRTLQAFVKQMFNYGRGRAEQSLITSSYPVTSFIPMFFIAYLLIALLYVKYVLLLTPLVLYLALAFVMSLFTAARFCKLLPLHLFWLFPLMHVANGIGLLCGLIKGKPEAAKDSIVRVRKLKCFGKKVGD